MPQYYEIVIHAELDPNRLAEFPTLLLASLDVWAEFGLVGETAAWAVYRTDWQPTDVLL